MKTFDPKEKKERYTDTDRSQYSSRRSYSRRDDASSNSDYDTPAEFMKDQRRERRQYSSTESRGNSSRGERGTERRSFNPNFTRENRLKDEDRRGDRTRRNGGDRGGKSLRKNNRYNDWDQEYDDNRKVSREERPRRNSRDGYAYYADRDRNDNRYGGERNTSRDRKGSSRYQDRNERGEGRSFDENRQGRYGDRRNNNGNRREGGRYGDRRKGYQNYAATNYTRFAAPTQNGNNGLNRYIAT